MNVFVLCTGRCGSVSFTKACHHITNYTVLHESRKALLGKARLDYPPNHIEVDNRLAWVLGRLHKAYGNDAFYVHLIRNREDTARSFDRRWHIRTGIIRAYSHGILSQQQDDIEVCRDYWDTVNANIEAFLRDKTQKTTVRLEHVKRDFRRFWEMIGAEGDLDAALEGLSSPARPEGRDDRVRAAVRKLKRLAVKFPDYVRNA